MRNKRNIVGKVINFRGLIYAPVEENGVIFLFSKIANDLNMYIETIRKGFPDCIAKRYIGSGRWEEVNIEFEFKSSDFVRHRHLERMKSGTKCDMIVCWEHDWTDYPKDIEVLELRKFYLQLPNQIVEEPDATSRLSEYELDYHFKNYNESKKLYEKLHQIVTGMNKEIWRKIAKWGIMYYSPERVFFSVRIQKQGLRLHLFTNGKNLKSVEPISEEGEYAQKWGRLYIKNSRDLHQVKSVLSKSHTLIKNAIRNNESTGWYAEIQKE